MSEMGEKQQRLERFRLKTDRYWQEFASDTDQLFSEWREMHDPDGDLSDLELIERATAAASCAQERGEG